MGTFDFTAYNKDINQALLAWIQSAAAASPYNVKLTSGYRPGDPRFHGKHQAADVELFDPQTGKMISNYQTPESFNAYQGFANLVRQAQMKANPEAANLLRWGGYFSGGKGKYGALDLMHFDTGGDQVGMGGGGWEQGLSPGQAALWNLQGGGGVSGVSPVAEALASATGTNPILPEKTPFDFGKLGAMVADSRGSQGSPQVVPDPSGDIVSPPETAPVSEPPGNLTKIPGKFAQLQELADLFKVKPNIGQAGSPELPSRRF